MKADKAIIITEIKNLSNNSFRLKKYNNLLDTQKNVCFLTIDIDK